MRIIIALCIATILLNHPVCRAQNEAMHQASKDSTSLEAVTVTETYLSRTPIAQTLGLQYIKRENLLLHQGNTFMNTLEKLPGISTINTGVGISKPVIRGMSLNRVIVNEYGIKQEGQQWGLDHGLELDQYNVDRVEVIKGPVSVLYGSDGLGGVVNILPAYIPGNDTFQTELINTYKSNNDLLGWSGKVLYNKNGYYITARATYQDYASYKVPAESFSYNGYTLPIYNKRLKNTGGKEFNFSLRTGLRKKWGTTSFYLSHFQQKAGFFVGAFGVPRAYQLNDNGDYRHLGLPYQQIGHTKLIANTTIFLNKARIEADLGFQLNNRRELSPPHAHGYGPATQGNEALALTLYTLSGNIRYVYNANERWSSTSGLSILQQQNIRDGYEFLIPSFNSLQAGLYNFTEYRPLKNLLFNAGIRMDYGRQKAMASFITSYDSSGAATGQTNRSTAIDRTYYKVSGSAGTAWQLNPRQKITFNLGSAYRMPVMAELTANGVHHGTFRHEMGDSSIKAEQGYMADAGFNFNTKQLTIQFTPFVNYFSNYIYLSPSARFSPLPDAGQIYRYMGAKALFAGAELHTDWHIKEGWNNTFSAEYVWNKNLENSLGLPFTPPFSILEAISWQPRLKQQQLFEATTFSLSGQYFAAQKRVDRNEAPTPGYFLLNFSAANTFHISEHRITLFIQLRNITNAVYMNNMSRYRVLNLPEQGFNLQLMLRWAW